MKISAMAVDRPRVVLVCTLLICLLAVFAGMDIAVQRAPQISKAVILVAIPYFGALPTEVEEQISRKIEDALQGLDKVDFISSSSMRGSSVTQIIFLDGVDPKRARDDVEHLVNQVRRELPAGREIQPQVTDIDFDGAPIMLVTLGGYGDLDPRELKRIAQDVQDELETIPGVSNTQLFGGREREIHVHVNPDLMAQVGLAPRDIRDAVARAHAPLPAGSMNSGEFDPQVRNATRLRTVADIRDIVLLRDEDRLIRVGDVAAVVDTYERPRNYARMNALPSATIIVNKEQGINSLGAATAIKQRIREMQAEFPHIQFSCTRDVSQEIRVMFNVLGSSAVFGGLLVLVILAWTMGLRISLLVVTAIPVSTAVALVFLYMADIPISSMVIFAYILVLGMVVDGAIIVAENIHRHYERGEPPVMAAKIGIGEVGIPVIAADLTTVAAFLPMLLVPGIMGDFMGVLPKVVSLALCGSVIVDHFLIPVVAAYWFKQLPGHENDPVDEEDSLESRFHISPNRGVFSRTYEQVLRYSLHHRWVVMTCCAMGIVWASLMFGKVGFVFFPASDRGQFEISYELPLGYSIEQTLAASEVFTEPLLRLKESGELAHFVTAVGSSQGLASRLETDPVAGPEFGKVMVELKPPMNRQRHEKEIIRELREQIRPWPGMAYRIEEVEEGPPGGADVEVRLTGKDLEQLGDLAKRLAARLSQVDGTVDVRIDYRDDNPELVIDPRKAIVGLYDMTENEVAASVQMAVLGDTTVEMSIDDDDVLLRVQLSPEYQQQATQLTNLMLTSTSGKRTTIDQLAEVRYEAGLYAVNRYERRRKVSVYADVIAPVRPDDVFNLLREKLLPEVGFDSVSGNNVAFLGEPGTDADGVRAVFTGENEERDKGFNALLRSMIIGIVLIAGILVVQFNSFRQTAIVLFTVPLSFIGVVFGMWASGTPFSLASFIGLVSLTGIVVNDAIVLVDFTNQARRRGHGVYDALVEAGINRLRPVLLTTVTTIGGLLPLYLNLSGGAEFWQPLTGAIVYGLMFATVLTLLVIPVSYSLAYSRSDLPREQRGIRALTRRMVAIARSAVPARWRTARPLPAASQAAGDT